MKILLRFALVAALLAGAGLRAAERMPPAPPRYFNDYAGVVSGATADALDRQLEQYERASSNQLLVAIYPKMESDSSVEDYTVRVAQAWQAGRPGKNNGAVLFVFKEDRQLYIQVGYGLEPKLTDAIAHDIVENILKPRFRSGDYATGLREAVAAMIAATQGEYQGTGRTQADMDSSRGRPTSVFTFIFVGFVVVMFILNTIRRARSPAVFLNPGRRSGGIWWGGGPGSFGGGGFGGGGGGFSGGGGSFGGGGAGGKW